MSRLWKITSDVKLDDLRNTDWDLIELPTTIDTNSWKAWYESVVSQFDDYAYSPLEHKELVGTNHLKDFVFDYIKKSVWGNPKQWLLQWGVQREGVIPPVTAADPNYFTEMKQDFDSNREQLSHYMFGVYKELHSILGEDSFQTTKLLQYLSGEGLKPHVDIVDDYLFRLSIQIKTNADVKWVFSDSHTELLHVVHDHTEPTSEGREYTLEEGKMYLVNTRITHSLRNLGTDTVVILQTDPKDSALERLLSMESKVIC